MFLSAVTGDAGTKCLTSFHPPPPHLYSVCRPKPKRFSMKKNPLKNLGVMLRLNPHAKSFRRNQILLERRRRKEKQELLDKKRGLTK